MVTNDKCEFSVKKIEFLGYIVVNAGLSMTDSKDRYIQTWKRQEKVNEGQAFIGFANFYRRFIDVSVSVAMSLTDHICQTFPLDCLQYMNIRGT